MPTNLHARKTSAKTNEVDHRNKETETAEEEDVAEESANQKVYDIKKLRDLI